jgi:hypothetical protein
VVASYWSFVCTVECMGRNGSPPYRARQQEREREQQRRQQGQRAKSKAPASDLPGTNADGRERRAAAAACAWCGGPIVPRSRGPIPKWCSATCRHRAWEQALAAASGRSAVQVVERRVPVHIALAPTRRDWCGLLAEFVHHLDDGRVYDRDLPGLARALEPVLQAYRRRAHMTGAPNLY